MGPKDWGKDANSKARPSRPKTRSKDAANDQEAFLLGKILEEEKVLLNCSAPEVAIQCRGHHGQEEEEVTQMTPGCSDLLLFFDFTI